MSDPITPRLENEMRLRLGVLQQPAPGAPGPVFVAPAPTCPPIAGSLDIAPHKGDRFLLRGVVGMVVLDGREVASPNVTFRASNGQLVTFEMDGLHLRLTPNEGSVAAVLPGVTARHRCSRGSVRAARPGDVRHHQTRGTWPSG